MNKLTILFLTFCATILTGCFPKPKPPVSNTKITQIGEILTGKPTVDSGIESPETSDLDSQSASDTPASLSEENLKKLKAQQEAINKKCISHNFYEGYEQTFNLYGKSCLNGTRLVIKTADKGQPVSTSYAIKEQDGTGGFRLEGDVKEVNQFHIVPYNIVKGEGHDEIIPYLTSFLPETEEFKGALNSRYHIIFELKGDHLVLFKASKNLKNIPYTERTSMERDKNGNYKKDKDGYYRAPFIGYPIKYCKAARDKNPSTGKEKQTFSPDCGPEHTRADATKDIAYINIGAKKTYKYVSGKVDLFPENYFNPKEQWFFSAGFVEGSGEVGHLPPFTAQLIKMRRTSKAFEFIDVSGTVDERNRKAKGKLPIEWQDYEWAQKDNFTFEVFGERLSETKTDVNRPYVKIDFSQIQSILSIQQPGLVITSGELIDILITPDYFSYIFRLTAGDGQQAKYKTSLLRESAVNKKGFIAKQWFREDHNHIFGFLAIQPQTVLEQGDISEEHLTKAINVIRFNTSAKETTIKWHFSKNTPKDEFYRDVARQAVKVWDQAFQHITKGTGKKIRIVLAEEEGNKDLGDLRYNIINLIKTKEAATRKGGILFGMAPSYAHADTGQIIGTTANVVINNIEGHFLAKVRAYIRYEIYQKDKDKKYSPEKKRNSYCKPSYKEQNCQAMS